MPAAIMDSGALTIVRTAAATGIAARHLARPDARTATIIGCGAQARAQLAAVCAVRPMQRVTVVDLDPGTAERMADTVGRELGIEACTAPDASTAARDSDIVITCTPSRRPYLGVAHVRPGTFIAAVGADSEHKSEIDPSLMALAAVVVDDLEQCASIGDLHHAIAAGLMTKADVRAELGHLVCEPDLVAYDPTRITLFDSTGVALQDAAAAALVYARARERHAGHTITLGRVKEDL
jgi:ornithine cyclodeaminase/alanine dehydrogenase-like protein (mu-crystallin family)